LARTRTKKPQEAAAKPRKAGCRDDAGAPIGIRRSRSGPRRALVLLAVHALIAVHIGHWLATGSTVSPIEPSEAMEFSKHSIVNAGLVFFALATVSTLVFGRFFCGWGCHLVALQDLCRHLLLKVGIRPRPLRSRLLALVPVAAFVYMFLWPAAYRLWIGDSFAPRGSQLSTTAFWKTFPGLGVALLTFATCGFAAVYFLGSKGFCAYACPYGALFGAVDRLAPGRIRVTDACEGCGHCTATCTSNVVVHQEVRDYGMVVDPGCMKCMDCVSVCPKGALYFGFGRPAARARPRREPARRRPAFGWGAELGLAAVFLATFLVFRGLYDLVPFLFSLGIAGIVAYLALLLVRTLRGGDVSLQNLGLRRAGRLAPAGWGLIAFFLVLTPFSAHSAVVQYHEWRSAARFEDLAGVRAAWFSSKPALGEAELEASRALEAHASSVQSWSLLPRPESHHQVAWTRLLRGDEAGFLEQLDRALELRSSDARLHMLRGTYERSRERLAEAAPSFQRACEADAGLVAAYVAHGEVLSLLGRFPEAFAVYETGMAAVPQSFELPFNYGVSRGMAGDVAGARRLFERTLELEPHSRAARENLAGLLCQTGEFRAAIAHLRALLADDPADVDSRLLLAQSLAAVESWSEALAELARAVADAPQVPELARMLEQWTREHPEAARRE